MRRIDGDPSGRCCPVAAAPRPPAGGAAGGTAAAAAAAALAWRRSEARCSETASARPLRGSAGAECNTSLLYLQKEFGGCSAFCPVASTNSC